MTLLPNNSTARIGKMTEEITLFLNQLHRDIDDQYSSLQTILSAISETLEKLTLIQNYLLAEVNSINGILFYLLLFMSTSLVSSIQRFQSQRFPALAAVIVCFFIEWLFGVWIVATIGNLIFRCSVISVVVIMVFNGESKEDRISRIIYKQLDTAKMVRVLRKAQQLHNS